MDYILSKIRLDKLNIPVETLRQSATKAADQTLKLSLETHGVYVPLVITQLGKGEYAVWDGTRRVRLLRELGTSGATMLPCIVYNGGDVQSVVAQMTINQARERLGDLAEAEGLRQLVLDHNMQQVDAAKLLLKSKTWASDMMRIWRLPEDILADLRAGELALSHAKVISKYNEQPDIMNLLWQQAMAGDVSHERLSVLGYLAEKNGVEHAQDKQPKKIVLTQRSWVRVMPLKRGFRAEMHVDQEDDIEALQKTLIQALKSYRD